MRRWLRPISVLSCLILFSSMLLTACGGSSTDSSSSGPVTLTMWTWKTDNLPGLQAIAKDFKAQTGITVNVSVYTPDASYRTKVTTAAQSSTLPDVLSYWSGSSTDDIAASGLLQSLQGKVDNTWQSSFLPGTYDQNSVYTQAALDACKADSQCEHSNLQVGQVFSVPYVAGQAMFVYANKSLLQKAGLPLQAPKTAEEWESMMQTIKAKTGTAGLVTGVKNPDVLNYWLFQPMLMTSCGVDTYNAIYTGKDHFTNPCAVQVLNWMKSLATNNLWMPGILQTDIDPADQAFAQGKAAFDIGGTYTLSGLIANGMSSDNLISFPVPALQGSAYSNLQVSPTSLIDVGITKDSKHPDEALKFIKFLTSQKQMETFAKTNNDIPAAKVDGTPANVGPVISSLLSGFSANSPFSTSKGQIQQLVDTKQVLETGFQQFITGETTPSALASKADSANQSALHK